MSGASPNPKRLKLPETIPNKTGAVVDKGLLLDDFVGVVDQLRREHGLPSASFSLDRVEKDCPWTKDIVANLILRTIKVNSDGIFAAEHPLLSKLGGEVSGPMGIPPYRIPREAVDHNLRRVLEAALQTLTLLPNRDPLSEYPPKNMRALSLRLSKIAAKMASALTCADVYNRFSYEDQARLRRLPGELAWTADALKKALSTTRRMKTDSPNPQVRFALYLIAFLEGCTGRMDYRSATTLIRAAFTAAKKNPPKWIDRLAIEMHAKRKTRKAWGRRILVSHPASS